MTYQQNTQVKHKVDSIKTIEQLILKLSETNTSEYTKALSALDLPAHYFDEKCTWSKQKYTRTCLYKDEVYELILLCWDIGNKTPIHCHGGEECWVRVIKGSLEEVFYKESENGLNQTSFKTQQLEANGISYISDFVGLHSLENVSKGRSLSLHLYAKPIEKCRYYDKNQNKMIYNTMRYDIDLSS